MKTSTKVIYVISIIVIAMHVFHLLTYNGEGHFVAQSIGNWCVVLSIFGWVFIVERKTLHSKPLFVLSVILVAYCYALLAYSISLIHADNWAAAGSKLSVCLLIPEYVMFFAVAYFFNRNRDIEKRSAAEAENGISSAESEIK